MDIPSKPEDYYKKKGWIDFGDWLGTTYLPFEQAREFVRKLGLKNQKHWRTYCKSKVKPITIPSNPDKIYKKKGWIDFGDWLGTFTIAPQNQQFLPFEQAREFVRKLGLKTSADYQNYHKKNKPKQIPYSPDRHYKNKGWKNWGNWLGTKTTAPQKRKYRSFTDAREFARSLNLTSSKHWEEYVQNNELPEDIPKAPSIVYKEEWTDWGDFLGSGRVATQDAGWSIEKVKELLRSMIETRVIYEWSEARLYKFLLTKGVLNLKSENKHSKFFKNLINATRTDDGRRIIEDYAFSKSNDTPDLFNISQDNDDDSEIKTASTEELSKLVNENFDPLDYKEPPTVEQILSSIPILESINVDEEAMQFFLRGSVNDFWKRAFLEEEKTILALKNEGKNGHKFHDTVIEIFLSEYENTQKLKIPKNYSSDLIPTLMQKYVAYKISTSPYFGNFSGTGAGKTLSAILASRIIDSKMTVIVCPNDIVSQWENEVKRMFSNSYTFTEKNAFYTLRDPTKYQYIILNYDKFNQSYSSNLILKLMRQTIDLVILDEIHYTKVTSEDEASLRNRHLVNLITGIKKKNPDAKVLGLSATPVVNNLNEGKSLLEMITGKIYDDIKTKATVPNAVTLYEKLSTIAIREVPSYNIDIEEEFVEVDAELDLSSNNKILLRNPLSTEQILTKARINEIISHIDKTGFTIIYTEYVGNDIIKNLSNAIGGLGLKVAFHTGSDHTGKKLFQEKKAQVLIASSPLSIGVDGLQKVCNRLIINSLPWTNARYQQLIGRLVRKGQIHNKVKVIIILASLKIKENKYEYDQRKWNRIQYKKTLADCAVDGILPEKNLVTKEQAHKEAIQWLERLERGEISTVSRRDLEIELTSAQKESYLRKYGDITLQHQKINSEYSFTTHERIKKDPQEWIQYHRQLNEKRKTWSIDPLEVIIAKLETMSPRLKIGDFGCGTAKIMEKIGFERVISFDHHAINDKVIECDMKSVSKYIDDNSLDVIVFSLSLMGKNWQDYIIEAKRCLSTRGSLLIAVTTHELDEGRRLHSLPTILKNNGFSIDTIEERGDFTFMEGIKI